MKSLKDFYYLLSLDRRYTKTESEIFRFWATACKHFKEARILRQKGRCRAGNEKERRGVFDRELFRHYRKGLGALHDATLEGNEVHGKVPEVPEHFDRAHGVDGFKAREKEHGELCFRGLLCAGLRQECLSRRGNGAERHDGGKRADLAARDERHE